MSEKLKTIFIDGLNNGVNGTGWISPYDPDSVEHRVYQDGVEFGIDKGEYGRWRYTKTDSMSETGVAIYSGCENDLWIADVVDEAAAIQIINAHNKGLSK